MNMKQAYQKDLWRTIKHGKKRFFSILLITMLGLMTLTGVTAACRDLRYSADMFFDRQKLYDISIVSTLGLTEEDVEAIREIEDVEQVEGSYSETVDVSVAHQTQTSEVKALSRLGLNEPYVLEGRLPGKGNEIAVTERYLRDAGVSVGDTLTFEEVMEEGEAPNFKNTSYTITGVVIDVQNVNSAEGSAAFRAASQTDYTFFVTGDAVDSEVYTAIYLTLQGSKELACYSSAYEDRIDQVVHLIETKIKEQREEARYQDVYEDAEAEIEDARADMEGAFAEADREFADAKEDLKAGLASLNEGKAELAAKEADAEEAFANARKQLEDGSAALAAGERKLNISRQELAEGEAQLASGKKELQAAKEQAGEQFQAGEQKLLEQKAQTDRSYEEYSAKADEMAKALPGWPKRQWEALVSAFAAGDGSDAQKEFLNRLEPLVRLYTGMIDIQIKMLDPEAEDYEARKEALLAKKEQLLSLPGQSVSLARGLGQLQAAQAEIAEQSALLEEKKAEAEAQFAASEKTIQTQEQKLLEGRKALEAGEKSLLEKKEQLEAGMEALEREEAAAREQILDGKRELADGEEELIRGQNELSRKEADYAKKKQEAEEEIREAWRKLEDIDMTQWYIRDRTALSGYNNIRSDSTSIEALGNAFPVVFLIVAILIGLTTITRMVEEERGLIGTYKALGFSNREIRRKYLLFAVLACLLGGLIGDLCGFVILPKIIFIIFHTMYLLPEYAMQFDLLYGIGGMLLFLAGIGGAAWYACRVELKQTPAILMRPKAPGAGSRVFLERIPFIWRRLSFLNKVTARNLFRYKKRLCMTVGGIMGCTALVICGFTIKDTVSDLLPKQYDHINRYDLMAVCEPKDQERLLSHMEQDAGIGSYISMQTDSVKVINADGKEEKVQLYVVPEGQSLDRYIRLEDLEGKTLSLSLGDVYLTQNACRVLGLKRGDSMEIRDSRLKQAETTVTEVAQNYLGNMVYMNQETYEALFGEFEPNGILAVFSDGSADQIAYAKQLGAEEGMLSVVSTREMKEDFAAAFYLVNMVVYIILILAAGLAFVVLFTLSTTNISERVRELATIKVLGFYDKEVHSYANKETLVLTVIGILFGLPLGHILGNVLASVLEMPSIQFVASIHPISYVLAAALSFAFALVVNLVTNRILDRINMVEALKSIE